MVDFSFYFSYSSFCNSDPCGSKRSDRSLNIKSTARLNSIENVNRIYIFRGIRFSILRFETIATFLPTFHQFSASVLFQTSRVFCKSCTSVLQAFRECFSGFFNESTIFFRVALPSKAAEDFSTTRDKFIRGWQIFHHSGDLTVESKAVLHFFFSPRAEFFPQNSYHSYFKNRIFQFRFEREKCKIYLLITNYQPFIYIYSAFSVFAGILHGRGNIYCNIATFKMEFRLSDLTPVTPHLITWQTPRRSNMIRILSRRWVSGKLDDRKFAINFSDGPWRATYLPKLLHSTMLITLDTRCFTVDH